MTHPAHQARTVPVVLLERCLADALGMLSMPANRELVVELRRVLTDARTEEAAA